MRSDARTCRYTVSVIKWRADFCLAAGQTQPQQRRRLAFLLALDIFSISIYFEERTDARADSLVRTYCIVVLAVPVYYAKWQDGTTVRVGTCL